MPAWLKLTGALGIVAGLYLNHIALLANTFAAAVVKIQTERKQQVVSTGPYAYVRHPMYAGAIPLLLGTPLLLGSWWGVATGVVLIGLLAWRAVLEEETLARELEGYAAYAARVRYRMVPGVW
ncbi:isoprenylcysteine carboxylmethyltransferase family protein [Hyphomicrobium sp.]|uniref:methyltransferase family protein n=1 Tax=Hyphomicrobium sp. TaxID=82 RepID=UPI0025C11E9D|nr:isoprenylcysteine carboxylmethyltransferase family protein [Hyphomicrobium sp.]MCC7253758.1 isoprenylcysteine carboxylmethyltransferase family protein [Hyphomicrobium sp.]